MAIKNKFRKKNILPRDATYQRNDISDRIDFRRRQSQGLTEFRRIYPWAPKTWTIDDFVNFERNATPVQFNGQLRYPSTYKPKQAFFNKDYKTPQQHKKGHEEFKRNARQNIEQEQAAQVADWVNNPYNPLGWIPGIASANNIYADRTYKQRYGTNYSPYTLPAAMSIGSDAATVGFGLGPIKNLVGAYAGNVAGGLIGEQYDQPFVGSLIGSALGGRFANKLPKLSIDPYVYRLQQMANPWLFVKKPETLSSSNLPSFKFVKDAKDLHISKEVNQGPSYLLSHSNSNNQKLFGKALNLKKPKFNLKAYLPSQNSWNLLDEYTQPVLAGISAADLMFGDDNRNPYIKGLEWLALGRYGLNAFAKSKYNPIITSSKDYVQAFNDAQRDIQDRILILSGNKYKLPFAVPLYIPRDYIQAVSKPGFNYQKASFDDLLKFIGKEGQPKGFNLEPGSFSSTKNEIFDKNGRIVAKRGQDNKIVIVNDLALRDLLSKDIDVIDYASGNRYAGKITIGEDGAVNIPEEYTRTLRNNINYVQNTLFPGSGIKVYGSAAGVTNAGFPHATHDIDFYITQDSLNDLLKRGILSEKDKINPGTYTYELKPQEFGEQGKIDLNVLEQTPEGFATGLRAEELYRQYFPDEYFQALREQQALIGNNKISANTPLPIKRTPQELLDAMDPSSKTIMDSFDIDITNPAKRKHTLRALAHIVYSDPLQVSQGLNLFSKSVVGSKAKLFPLTADQLGNKELNLQALQKLGIDLNKAELDRIASDPQRMKNILDTWYMDNTAMRYIQGTWHGTTGYSADNFVRSATTWDPLHNKGDVNGAGLNTTIGGDSRHGGDLKAYILPRQEYKSTGLLELIDEINDNFGRNSEAGQILADISKEPKNQQVSKLQNVYDSLGWNFLQNGKPYGRGMYASATRPFDVATDAVGFQRAAGTSYGIHPFKLNPVIPRINRAKTNLLADPYNGILNRERSVMLPEDRNKLHQSGILKWLDANKNRVQPINMPFLNIIDEGRRFAPYAIGVPIGLTGIYTGVNSMQNKKHEDQINHFISSPDMIIQSMPEKDRNKFTYDGVEQMKNDYKEIYGNDISSEMLNDWIYYDLNDLYSKYKK